MTRVVISQPMYFPWAGFLAQMAMADVYIWLDDVQFSKGSFTNRIQVKFGSERRWMSVPLAGKGSFQNIADLQPTGMDWISSHRTLLGQSLRDRPHTAAALALFDQAVVVPGSLCDRLIASTEVMGEAMSILPQKRLRSSQMAVAGSSSDRVLALVKAVGGSEYLTGHGALPYLDHEGFEAAGVRVSYMDYNPLPWPQGSGEFTPYVTGLDLLASHEPSAAVTCLRPASVDWQSFKALREKRI